MTFVEDNAKAWSEITEMAKSRPQEFDAIETANGPGATLEATEALRDALPQLFEKYGIKTVLDVGCGDWNWMQNVDLSALDSYTGWDVEPSLIAENQGFCDDSSTGGKLAFQCQSLLDIEEIPQVDLILARHVLIHFPNDHVNAVLHKMARSGSTYLLTSTWPDGDNSEYEPEGFAWRGYMERPLNMQAPPFDLPRPVDVVVEPPNTAGVLLNAHQLGMFELGELGVCLHRSQHRVHRSDDTVVTVCNDCQSELDTRPEAGGIFSFHDTVARWQQDIDETGTVGGAPRSARIQVRPLRRRELLAELRGNHRDVLAMAQKDDSLKAAWALIGAQAAVIDAILDELLADEAE